VRQWGHSPPISLICRDFVEFGQYHSAAEPKKPHPRVTPRKHPTATHRHPPQAASSPSGSLEADYLQRPTLKSHRHQPDLPPGAKRLPLDNQDSGNAGDR